MPLNAHRLELFEAMVVSQHSYVAPAERLSLFDMLILMEVSSSISFLTNAGTRLS